MVKASVVVSERVPSTSVVVHAAGIEEERECGRKG